MLAFAGGMDDRVQIRGDGSPATSYGGVLPTDATGSVIQPSTNGVVTGSGKLDKAPLMTGLLFLPS